MELRQIAGKGQEIIIRVTVYLVYSKSWCFFQEEVCLPPMMVSPALRLCGRIPARWTAHRTSRMSTRRCAHTRNSEVATYLPMAQVRERNI